MNKSGAESPLPHTAESVSESATMETVSLVCPEGASVGGNEYTRHGTTSAMNREPFVGKQIYFMTGPGLPGYASRTAYDTLEQQPFLNQSLVRTFRNR